MNGKCDKFDITITYCPDGIELTMDTDLFLARVRPILIENKINFDVNYRDKYNSFYVVNELPATTNLYNAEVDITYSGNDTNNIAFAIFLIKKIEKEYDTIVERYNMEDNNDGTDGHSK